MQAGAFASYYWAWDKKHVSVLITFDSFLLALQTLSQSNRKVTTNVCNYCFDAFRLDLSVCPVHFHSSGGSRSLGFRYNKSLIWVR